jgi:ribosome assembly protein 4
MADASIAPAPLPAVPAYVAGGAALPLSQLSLSQLKLLAAQRGAAPKAGATRAELEAACAKLGATSAAPADIASGRASGKAYLPGGSLIAHFETAEGERTGPQLDVPAETTPAQLQLILNQLLANEDRVPYSFYVGEEEVTSTLGGALGAASAEQTLRVVYVPQAVFRVRAVTRCTSTLSGHSEAILSSSFSADGRLLATGSGDHCVRLWDVMTETPRATLKAHRDWVLCVAWSPCGRFLASGGKDGRVALWAAAEPAYPLKVIEAHKKWVNALAWQPYHLAGPAGSRLASASKDGTIRLWERATGRSAGTLCGHTDSVSCLRWGGDGLLYSGSHDRTVKVWADAKLVRTLEGHGEHTPSPGI